MISSFESLNHEATIMVPKVSLRRKPRVFLAEDDEDLRWLLCGILEKNGYEVHGAPSGHQLLRLLSSCTRGETPKPDILVMDVRMPNGGGLEVLLALRLAEWRQPVLMITGCGEDGTRERAAEYGATVVLDKPFEGAELLKMVQLLLERAADAEEDAEPITERAPILSGSLARLHNATQQQ
jgi:DNA-binding response OmpR family regulator